MLSQTQEQILNFQLGGGGDFLDYHANFSKTTPTFLCKRDFRTIEEPQPLGLPVQTRRPSHVRMSSDTKWVSNKYEVEDPLLMPTQNNHE